MAEITSEMVKSLREKTSAGMMDCKKALTECGGDMEQAVDYLRKKGLASANKRTDRAAKEGLVLVETADGGKTAMMLQINCETDFVAKNDDFKKLCNDIMKIAISSGLDKIDATNLPVEIDEMIKGQISKTGENTIFGGFVKVKSAKPGVVAHYVHSNNKIGVLLEVSVDESLASNEELQQLAKDISMQIAAANPMYLCPEDVPADMKEREKDIYREQMKDSGKPAPVIEKIIEGKLSKFYSEVCLLEQEFIKESSKKIKDLLKEKSTSLKKGDIGIERYIRFQI